jgi:prepilin-type processing-associated H-X9-DG protein
MPGLHRVREVARQAVCKMNLANIGGSIADYESSHGGQFPPDLQTLARGSRMPLNLACPSDPSRDETRMHETHTSSYFYCPPTPHCDDATLIACDFGRNHKSGCRNLLYADLHVGQALTDEEFQQLLAQPVNAKFAKALREAESHRRETGNVERDD